MKTIAYSIIVYFLLAFIFKLLGDMDNNSWVNYYWIFSSLFYSLIFLKTRHLCDIPAIKLRYNPRDIKLYKKIITLISAYWGIMLGLRLLVAFKIHLYHQLISSARTITIGAITIMLIFILLIHFLTAKRNDTKDEG